MAFDGMMLRLVKQEVERTLVGSRVDKIYQPAKEELILSFRSQRETYRLLLSARAVGPRVHFTELPVENPKQPPMFCMLLRKRIGSSKLIAVRQPGFERVLFLDFEGYNELGDLSVTTLAVETMGRHSNIIMIDAAEQKIVDAVKRISFDKSSVRQILPGLAYTMPPPQVRFPIDGDRGELIETLRSSPRDIELSKLLGETLDGASPILCREIAFFATRGADRLVSELGGEEWKRLRFYLDGLAGVVQNGTPTPTMVLTPQGEPKDVSFVPINQYGSARMTRAYPSIGELLDRFYGEKDAGDRMRQRMSDFLKLIINRIERIERKLAAQRQELAECASRDELRMKGDLLSSNLTAIRKGDRSAMLTNFFDPEGGEIAIELDPLLTPVQNVQRYYKEYRKADTAEKKLRELIAEGEKELVYLDSVFDLMSRAATDAELSAIRTELAEGGYLRAGTGHGRKKAEEKLPPLRYRSSDGFLIVSGRNNLQNDRLTLRESRNHDIWFHTQKIAGSHTIVVTEGKTPPDRTLTEAAVIAAVNSKARHSGKVAVDYTEIRNVKKQPGGKPGMVIYDAYQTAVVDPDEELVRRLAEP